MSVNKKARFEVFKRDKFTCQYCGKKAPEVILHADHLEPKSKGGSDDFLNLVTACVDCNQGKSDRVLSENTVLEKKQNQLEQLQERREQIEMLRDWERELTTLSIQELELIAEKIANRTGRTLSEWGRDRILPLIRKHGIEEVLKVVEETFSAFYGSGNETKDACVFAAMLNGLKYKLRGGKSPNSRIQYLSGILNRRINMSKTRWAFFTDRMNNYSGDLEKLIEAAKKINSWESFLELTESTKNIDEKIAYTHPAFHQGYDYGMIGMAFEIQDALKPLKVKFGNRFEKLETGDGLPTVWCFLRNLDDYTACDSVEDQAVA